MNPPNDALLRVRNLCVHVQSSSQSVFSVQDVFFDIHPAETVALVGESGSGKTLTALALLGLLPNAAHQTAGEILFKGKQLPSARLRGRHVAMIFQNPSAALNPVIRVGHQIEDVIRTHLRLSAKQAKGETLNLLKLAGLIDGGWVYRAYPHQLSGGMAQRVMIAMALSCKPDLIIADEPTTALDVITQNQILAQIRALQAEHGFALLLISHDMNVVARLADTIVVMRAGRMVESGPAQQLLHDPQHTYTRTLLNATTGIPNLASPLAHV
ncbi:MAG TPA: ABC transporter ATP-binding protein [bacterium]